MSRRKKGTSRVLEKAMLRSASLQSIGQDLDFGQGLTIPAYNQMIQDLRDKLTTYNTALSLIDKTADEIAVLEEALGDFSDRMLTGVATQFGKTSPEYGMAGGVRKATKQRGRAIASTVASTVASSIASTAAVAMTAAN